MKYLFGFSFFFLDQVPWRYFGMVGGKVVERERTFLWASCSCTGFSGSDTRASRQGAPTVHWRFASLTANPSTLLIAKLWSLGWDGGQTDLPIECCCNLGWYWGKWLSIWCFCLNWDFYGTTGILLVTFSPVFKASVDNLRSPSPGCNRYLRFNNTYWSPDG